MPLWPNNRRDIAGWQSVGLLGATSYFRQHFVEMRNREIALPAAGLEPTASWPNGTAPRFSLTLPIVTGGMSCLAYPTFARTANLLQGGPMQAPATMTMAMGTPSLGLTVGMTAPWTGTYTPTAGLRLTIGMTATYTAVFTGASNLAMVVPLGSTTFSAAFTGSSDLKGDMTMTASFGGAEPLSPEGLARAVWEALAADYNTAGTMGEKLNGAGSAGNPWTEVIEGTYTAGQIMRIMSAALAGKTSGQPTAPVFRNITDTANTISATVDTSGNRTAVTLNP